MEQDELLQIAVNRIKEIGLPYFVTGSMASIFHGETRTTKDIDIVIKLPLVMADLICRAFPPPDFYASIDAAREAARHHTMFNVIHIPTGLKLDLIVAPPTAWNKERFTRARSVEPLPGFTASFAAPEDVILSKLQFYKEGGSDKHLRDIAGILKISGHELDRAYINRWLDEFEVRDIWDAIVKKVEGKS